ncbi:hypothetical protein ABIB40_004039 [Pedobacter sp. UYP30]|uniref:hypothetical protein n=1 Tax=Pedobacter sp. UYP30 TaxID=1756400 RepID=UPI0033917ADF
MGFILTKIREYDAHGGPSTIQKGSDGNDMTPTTAGRFVIQSIAKHVSYGRYAFWSGVAWGTPMMTKDGVTLIKKGNAWTKLSSVNKIFGAYKDNESKLTMLLMFEYQTLYNIPRNLSPRFWVFNDFGHVSVKYFKDTNHDWKMDGKEHILGDFIHTTPGDEASTSKKQNFNLVESHGCIHVKPTEIDTMIGNGYIAKGLTIEVHPYNDKTIAAILKRPIARLPYETHFYPGLFKIVVYRVQKLN